MRASQRVFGEVEEGVVVVEDGGDDEEEEDVEVVEEVEAYRGKRVAVDRKPELLHRQCRIDIEGFIGRPERKRFMKGAWSRS